VPVESAKDQDGAAALPEGERLTSDSIGPVIAELLIFDYLLLCGLPALFTSIS
jgi:hypothetical protein